MAIAPVTVTFSLFDFLGYVPDIRRTKVILETNVDSGFLVDTTTGGSFRLADAAVTIDSTGLASFSVLPSGATGLNPSAYQIRVHIDAANPATKQRERVDLGWYTITAAANLKDLVAAMYVPPTYLSTVTTTLQGYVDEGQALLAEQVAISGISTSDAVVEALVKNTAGVGPLTSAALSATIAAQAVPTDKTAWAATTAYKVNDLAALPDGQVGIRLPGQPANSRATFDATENARWQRVAIRLPWLEGTAAILWGDSYGVGGYDSPAGTTYFDRLAGRHRVLTLTNRSVGSKRSDQILMEQVIPFSTPNARALHMIASMTLNDVGQYADTTKTPTTAAACEAIFAYLSSRYAASITDAGLLFGPGWTAGSSSTAGASVDVSFNGDSCWIAYTTATGAGGSFTIKDTAGSTLATVNTGGMAQVFTAVKKVSGFGAGNHTVRVAVASGTVALMGMWLPSPTPPTILWHRPAWNPNIGTQARHDAYLAAVDAVAAGFSNVVPISVDSFWNASTMLGPTTFHPNDLGNAYIANLAERAVAGAKMFSQGTNALSVFPTAAAVYTPTTPSYTSPGATAPAAPTSVTVATGTQLVVSWTRAGDGGATLTSYEVETSPDGTTWTSRATGLAASATSYTVSSGLTSGTAYYARVRAVNSVGYSAYGTSASTATAGGTAIAADTFNRADGAPGSTPTGSKAWTNAAATSGGVGSVAWGIVSNQLKSTGVDASGTFCVVNAAVSDGTIQVTKASPLTLGGGLSFRATVSSGQMTSGYVFWRAASDTMYRLSRYTGASYTAITNTTGVTPAVGDILKVVLNGTSIKCYVNGVLVITATDATYTGTSHGVYCAAIGALFDDFSVTDAIV